MNKFITRVELHGANSADYERLHGFMAAMRFHRTISADDGREFILPTAMYYSCGHRSVQDVRTLAIEAANRTGRPSWVLVSRYEETAWSLPVAAPVSDALPGLAPAASRNALAAFAGPPPPPPFYDPITGRWV